MTREQLIAQWGKLAREYSSRSGVPVGYLLALIAHESGGNADDVNPTSHATGLLQITAGALAGFNADMDASVTMDGLRDPETNVRVGTWLLARIIKSWRTNHPATLSDAHFWKRPRLVALLTFGWNAGYSEKSGVGFVASRLEAAGIPAERITVDNVRAAAAQLASAGASRHLGMEDRAAWSKQVATAYFEGRYAPPPSNVRTWLWAGGIVALVGGVFVYRRYKEQERKDSLAAAREAKRTHKLDELKAAAPRVLTIPLPQEIPA